MIFRKLFVKHMAYNYLIMKLIALTALVFFHNLVYSKTNSSNAQKKVYDIVVIGGTPAGIAASIAAGRNGNSVILIEQAPLLGGTLSSGVDRLDDYLVESNSGIMEEFRTRVMNYNINELKSDPVVQKDLKDPDHRWSSAQGRSWEPKIAARISNRWLQRYHQSKLGLTKFL